MPDLATSYGGPILSFGSVPASSTGVLLTANASNNVKGAWVEVIAALTGSASWLLVGTRTIGNARLSIDIGVGASTAEQVLIPDLYCENIASANQLSVRPYLLPVAIPSGKRIAGRCMSNIGSNQARITVQAISPRLDSPPPLGRCETLGFVAATTALTAIDPGGVANTDSAWVQLIATTSFRYHWLNIAVGHSASGTGGNGEYLLDIAVGANPNETSVIDDLLILATPSTDSPYTIYTLPVSIPAGVRVSARLRSTVILATDRILDVGAWGCG